MRMAKIEEKHIWSIIAAYFRANSIVGHQIESFDDFISFGLQEIVDNDRVISVPNYSVRFGQILVESPRVIEEDRSLRLMYPLDARRRDLNYDGAIMCDVTENYIDGDEKVEKTHHRVMIGRMPIMLRSTACNLSKIPEEERLQKGECPNDPGGYFVIKGNERVLTAQMRAVYNQIFVLKQKPGDKYKYVAETRSMSNETGHSVLIQAMIGSDDRTIQFSLPYVKEPIPIGVLFKAMGYLDDSDIISLIGLEEVQTRKYIRYILRDAYFCKSQDDALKYIGQYALHVIPKDKEKAYAWQVIETELLPHLGISSTIKEQACFMGTIVRKLLQTTIGLRTEDDRDNYANKRAETAGTLMYEIFRNLYKKFIQSIRLQLDKRKQRPDILSTITRAARGISKGLHQCLSTGNWGVQKNASYVRTGVSQILDRMTYGATISHLRRLIIPIGKEGKNAAMRQIHGSSAFFCCPAETPEGQKIGVVLNLALTAKLTKRLSTVMVKKSLERCDSICSVEELKLNSILTHTPVFLNGAIIGYSQNPDETVEEIRRLRQDGILPSEVSVTYDRIDNDIRLYSDEGRFIRPLLTIKNQDLALEPRETYKWRKLIKNGWIRYLDASEIENCVLAMRPEMLAKQQCDYCEIHPSLMLGVMAGLIPFPDHSQSPRNCYQCSMGKQALGMPVTSYRSRTDTLLHILHYPQKPLVVTKMASFLRTDEMPSGVNAIVAVACYTGFNQEDSVLMNWSSIQRGLFCLTTCFTIDCTEKKRDTYSYEEICLPPTNSDGLKEGQPGYFRRKNANYSLLDDQGIIRPRELYDPIDKKYYGPAVRVNKGDVLVGKIVVTGSKNGEETRLDASVVVQPGEEGVIDRVYTTITPNGHKLVKVVIRVTREPQLGDKVASRAAQKGTIGMLYRQEDMPFTASGITPDIIMNPLALPSRMTVNQLIECVLGKQCTITGERGDATPFTEHSRDVANKIVGSEVDEKRPVDSDQIISGLRQYGFQDNGWEMMYNGMTGEPIKAKIFIGPTYYQRLKHMVDDKMHARAKGHVTTLTRQPLEGRARDGGLRFGEMERDCMLAHGSARFLKERLFDVSDPFQVAVCKKCGIMAATEKECQSCKGDQIVYCNMPYASKLMIQELTALGLKVRINPDQR